MTNDPRHELRRQLKQATERASAQLTQAIRLPTTHRLETLAKAGEEVTHLARLLAAVERLMANPDPWADPDKLTEAPDA